VVTSGTPGGASVERHHRHQPAQGRSFSEIISKCFCQLRISSGSWCQEQAPMNQNQLGLDFNLLYI